jgi:hypothetical protein
MLREKMKPNAIVQCSMTALSLLLLCGPARAQAPAPPSPGTPGPELQVQTGPVDGGFAVAFRGRVEVVKGHGYQADAVTETTQTLADGSHISHKMVATVARDAEGRTMRTETLDGMGLWGGGANDKQIKITTVFDPVAGTHMHWQSDSKTATVMPMPRPGVMGSGPVHFNAGEVGSKSVPSNEPIAAQGGGIVTSGSFGTEAIIEDGAMPPPPGPDTVFIGEMHTEVIQKPGAASSNETTEQLGTRMVEGVEAVGTRVTQVIPAGTIGNDKDLVSTRETWFSSELKIVVSSIRNDPRFGQIRYTLSNIQVAEPSPSLFQPPPGYTLLHPRAPGM